MSAAIKTTAPITVAGRTGNVEIDFYGDDPRGETDTVFVATIGKGIARYPTEIILTRLSAGQRPPAGTLTTHAADGTTLAYHLQTTVRNRPAHVVGWFDADGATNYADQTRA